jgi:aspartate/methionine/tyrosine aminotransferase
MQLFEKFLESWKGVFSWVAPRAGCVGFCRYLLKGSKTLDELADILARDYGVLILPGSVYGAEFNDHFRIGFGRENFKDSLEAFQAALLKVLYE